MDKHRAIKVERRAFGEKGDIRLEIAIDPYRLL